MTKRSPPPLAGLCAHDRRIWHSAAYNTCIDCGASLVRQDLTTDVWTLASREEVEARGA